MVCLDRTTLASIDHMHQRNVGAVIFRILAVFQYAFLSVLVFLWTCETSSFAAQVLSQYPSLHFGNQRIKIRGCCWHAHFTQDESVGNLCELGGRYPDPFISACEEGAGSRERQVNFKLPKYYRRFPAVS